MPSTIAPDRFRSRIRSHLTLAYLCFVFLFGGGAREDIAGLVILRPVSAIVLAIGLLGLRDVSLRPYRFVLIMAAAIVTIALLHVIPLPPRLWGALPGRDLIERIDAAAGVGAVWRPLALVPAMAWNGLFSLLPPLAMLVLVMRAGIAEQIELARGLIAIGLVSAIVGVAQLAAGPDSPLYFYSITNSGALVGLFSNRNHHAIFLASLLPILGFLASLPAAERVRLQLRWAILAFLGLFLVAAMLVTGSRAGFGIGLASALVAMAIFRQPVPSRRSHKDQPKAPSRWQAFPLRAASIAAIAIVAVLFLGFSDSPLAARLFGTADGEELRFRVWGPILTDAWGYFPFGSGNGSFADVYKIGERSELLHFNYLNHAHNDWIEVVLTVGLPALVLLAIATAGWATATWRVFVVRRDAAPATLLGRLGAGLVALLALASFADYPLRTPSIICLFVLAVTWLAQGVAHPVSGKSEND